jgi:DNA modification methylase
MAREGGLALTVRILVGDCRERLRELPDASVNCCVTSPPYFGLRDYGHEGQMGLEPTPDEFVAGMVEVFREVRRVLRDDGTLWLNIGDSYCGAASNHKNNGSFGDNSCISKKTQGGIPTGGRADRNRQLNRVGIKQKDLIGIPWMLAFALRADGWYLRQDIIWSKPNPMPESVRDRCTKAHEYLFMLTKSARYYYDADAIKNPPSQALIDQIMQGYNGSDTKDYASGGAQSPSETKARIIANKRDKQKGHSKRHAGFNARWDAMTKAEQIALGSNKRSVWEVATKPFAEAHFATYPPALIEPCILAGCPKGGTVLDPFGGAGTTGLVAGSLHRDAILIELNEEYAKIAHRRLTRGADMFAPEVTMENDNGPGTGKTTRRAAGQSDCNQSTEGPEACAQG